MIYVSFYVPYQCYNPSSVTTCAMLDTKHLPMLGHFKPLLAGTDPPRNLLRPHFLRISIERTTLSYFRSKNFGESPYIREISRNLAASNPQKRFFCWRGTRGGFPSRTKPPFWGEFPSSIVTTRLTQQNWHLRPLFRRVSARGETWAKQIDFGTAPTKLNTCFDSHAGTSLWSISHFQVRLRMLRIGEFQPSFNFTPILQYSKKLYSLYIPYWFQDILCVLFPPLFWDYKLYKYIQIKAMAAMPGCAPLPAPARLSSHRAHVAAGLLGRWHRWSPVDGSPNLGAIRLCHMETQNLADSLDVYIYVYFIYIYSSLFICICYIHLYIHSSSMCIHTWQNCLPHKETSSCKNSRISFWESPSCCRCRVHVSFYMSPWLRMCHMCHMTISAALFSCNCSMFSRPCPANPDSWLLTPSSCFDQDPSSGHEASSFLRSQLLDAKPHQKLISQVWRGSCIHPSFHQKTSGRMEG